MTTTVINNRKHPCQGCPDRYPACSDHCRKEAFLAWKAEHKKIRENRQAYTAGVWAKEEWFPRKR